MVIDGEPSIMMSFLVEVLPQTSICEAAQWWNGLCSVEERSTVAGFNVASKNGLRWMIGNWFAIFVSSVRPMVEVLNCTRLFVVSGSLNFEDRSTWLLPPMLPATVKTAAGTRMGALFALALAAPTPSPARSFHSRAP